MVHVLGDEFPKFIEKVYSWSRMRMKCGKQKYVLTNATVFAENENIKVV